MLSCAPAAVVPLEGSSPYALDIFNAPTREHASVERERTNTPLQALVTMNDTQFVEASRYLAQKAMREAGDGFDRGSTT